MKILPMKLLAYRTGEMIETALSARCVLIFSDNGRNELALMPAEIYGGLINASTRPPFERYNEVNTRRVGQAVRLLPFLDQVSVSKLQLKLNVGYSAAVQVIQVLEDMGLISKPSKNGTRKVICFR